MHLFGKKNPKLSEIDTLVNNLPLHPELKSTVRLATHRWVEDKYNSQQDKMSDLQIIRDATDIAVQDILEKSRINRKDFNYVNPAGGNLAGYSPGGSILKKIYPMEFALHCFINEAYWAAAKSRRELWVEMHRDDYILAASDSVPKKTIKLINGVLEDLNVRYMRNKLRDNLLINGNCLLQNKRNRFGGLLELNPLLMERVEPAYDRSGEVLVGWHYWSNGRPNFLPYDQVDHIKTYNARSNVLGMPALASCIVDVEASLQAAIYNNNVMQKGGLLSVVFRLKSGQDSGVPIADKLQLNLADEFTKWLERRFGGIRNSGQMAFIPMIEGVDILNKIGEMDSAWSNLDESTAIKVCGLLGLFPERIGLTRTSQYENKQLVDDGMSLSMDNNNYYVTDLVDEYLTRIIIKEGLGIDNVAIQASGEFSAITKTASDVGLAISQMGADVMTVDQFRVEIMHIDPLGGELGQKFLGEVTREAAMQKAQNSGSNLTKAIGPLKEIALAQYAEIPYVKHKARYIKFY